MLGTRDHQAKSQRNTPLRRVIASSHVSNIDSVINLVTALQRIDATAEATRLNETSISDNNGGRIML